MAKKRDPETMLAEAVALYGSLGGKAVEARKPKAATEALELLAMGKSHREVTKITGITFDELVGLKNRHAKTLAERKAHLAFDGFEMVEAVRMLQKEKLRSLADDPKALAKVNVRDLAITQAVYQDKALAALGEQEKEEEKPKEEKKALSLEDAVRVIEEAKAKLKRVAPEDTAPVIEVQTKPALPITNSIGEAT